MIKEAFCVVAVLISSIIRSDRVSAKVCNLVENTFVVSERKKENVGNEAVKVFGNSAMLKDLVVNSSEKTL